jgi:hypothetical protein
MPYASSGRLWNPYRIKNMMRLIRASITLTAAAALSWAVYLIVQDFKSGIPGVNVPVGKIIEKTSSYLEIKYNVSGSSPELFGWHVGLFFGIICFWLWFLYLPIARWGLVLSVALGLFLPLFVYQTSNLLATDQLNSWLKENLNRSDISVTSIATEEDSSTYKNSYGKNFKLVTKWEKNTFTAKLTPIDK